jgi:hypothetical protein
MQCMLLSTVDQGHDLGSQAHSHMVVCFTPATPQLEQGSICMWA